MNEDIIMEMLNADNSEERFLRELPTLNPNEHFGYAGTPLTMAVDWDDIEVVKLLLAHDGNVNERASIWDKPPLWFAVRNENEAMISLLVTSGALVPYSGALHQAASHLNPSILRLLLKHGADPLEVEDGDGMPRADHQSLTALHRAVQPSMSWQFQEQRVNKEPHLETVRTLLNCGINVHAKTGSGVTALEMARSSGFTNVVELLESWQNSADGVYEVGVSQSLQD